MLNPEDFIKDDPLAEEKDDPLETFCSLATDILSMNNDDIQSVHLLMSSRKEKITSALKVIRHKWGHINGISKEIDDYLLLAEERETKVYKPITCMAFALRGLMDWLYMDEGLMSWEEYESIVESLKGEKKHEK